jgi:Phage protein (N4 Gp49/phage Sf6 gene 66) family
MTQESSLRVGDDEAAAVQKTKNRVALDAMLAKVTGEEYIWPESMPHMTICVLTVENGFALVGKSTPADPDNFDRELGRKFAREDAVRQMWPLEAYLLRERMML